MSDASSRLEARAGPTNERLDPWIAAFVSALLHLLALLALLYASTPTVTTPQGAAGGSRVKVDFVGETRQPATQGPPSPPPTRTPQPVPAPPAASPVQSTLVDQSDNPVPPNAATASDGPAPTPALQPMERPSVSPPQRSEATDAATQRQARAPAASPPATTRRPRVWGQPPGLVQEDTAPVNTGLSRSPAVGRSRGNEASSADASLEVGGYQVHYQLVSEARLRTWRDAGMTELFMPLPGTTRYMVCPLETALKRESGPCRLLDPDSPQLKAIGDAREVIAMQQVYRRGELVWRGPGPYR